MDSKLTHKDLDKLKPSKLLELALSDMEKVLKIDNNFLDMGSWITSYENSCSLCLAGSILYSSMGYRDYKDEPVYRWMGILDSLRMGFIYEWDIIDYIYTEIVVYERPIILYKLTKLNKKYKFFYDGHVSIESNFKEDLNKLKEDLIEIGL